MTIEGTAEIGEVGATDRGFERLANGEIAQLEDGVDVGPLWWCRPVYITP
jgi:hypothetical protein